MKKRVAILISGGGSNMVALVRSMQAENYAQPVLVLANDPKASGLEKAKDLGVPVTAIDHLPFGKDRKAFEAQVMRTLEAARPDIICLAGFMRVLSPEFVDHWQNKILNIHPSLLPKYKGLNTHARAIQAGDTQAGCSVHMVTAKLDDGPILGQATVPILPGDTANDLATRILPYEHQLYPLVLKKFTAGDQMQIILP